MAALEEKKRSEEAEVQVDLTKKRIDTLAEIKTKYNQLASEVKIDFESLKEILKRISSGA